MDKYNKYNEYISLWADGLFDEICFWDNFMKNEGGIFFYGFSKTTSPDRSFELEEDIPQEKYGHEYKFIDVGAGPFSRCGRVTDKVKLEALSVDPLAYAYSILKKKYSIDNNIRLETGFVELLDRKFKPNSFDMVHMSNSLDHCFSAIDGIYQLLNICKIGGKVILRHAENEALRENYVGLHQWNLSLHNEENSFVVWRNNQRYDVCKIFADYADIELIPDVKENTGHWIYNKVVMVKKKEISIPDNDYYDVILDKVYEKLLDGLLGMSSIMNIVKKNNNDIAEKRIETIKYYWHNKDIIKRRLNNKKITNAIIYGMGNVGSNLDYLLTECGIKTTKLDARGSASRCVDAITFEQCKSFEADVIITTVEDIDVINKLKYVSKKDNVYRTDEFLELLRF